MPSGHIRKAPTGSDGSRTPRGRACSLTPPFGATRSEEFLWATWPRERGKAPSGPAIARTHHRGRVRYRDVYPPSTGHASKQMVENVRPEIYRLMPAFIPTANSTSTRTKSNFSTVTNPSSGHSRNWAMSPRAGHFGRPMEFCSSRVKISSGVARSTVTSSIKGTSTATAL